MFEVCQNSIVDLGHLDRHKTVESGKSPGFLIFMLTDEWFGWFGWFVSLVRE